VDYYRRIASTSLPHLRGRPLIMERYPEGISKGGFFQRKVPDYFPTWIDRVALRKVGGKVTEAVAGDDATLVYMAEQNCITVHAGLSRREQLEYPARMIIDLDPSGDDFSMVQKAALTLKTVLDELQLESFVQLTGSRGMHIVIALDRSQNFDQVHEFARELAIVTAKRNSSELTVEQRKDKRGRRVFLDYMRNSYSQTAVAPYSVRAREGAPVATPITWSEASARGLSPGKYNIGNVFRRLSAKGDAWSEIDRAPVSPGPIWPRLCEMAQVAEATQPGSAKLRPATPARQSAGPAKSRRRG
jgi:bifunctional non-homologous end joining protein LigD